MISTKKIYLLVGLLATPLIVLIIQHYLFLSVDSKYSAVIDDEAESITLVQKLTSESINNYFILRNLMQITDKNEKDTLKQAWLNNYTHINEYVNNLSSIGTIKLLTQSNFDYLVNARKEYIDKCKQFFDVLNTNDKKSINQFFSNNIESSFFAYQNAIGNFISIHKSEVKNYNVALSNRIKFINPDSTLFGIRILYVITVIYFLFACLYLFFLIKVIVGRSHKTST